MGRHEIKLRRHRMTSRRIEGYKDYNSLLARHRSTRTKRLLKFIFLLLFFITLSLFTYFALSKLNTDKDIKPANQAQIISRPDVLINVTLNTANDGKT